MTPLWGLAAELKRRGHRLTVAAERHHSHACRVLGIELVALPGSAGPLAATPDSEIETLLPLARCSDLLLGNQLASSTAIIGHLADIPWVYCIASPLAIPSRHDPPYWPVLHRLQHATRRSAGFQRGAFHLVRAATRVAMIAQQRQRRRHGLRDGAHPRFEAFYSPRLNLIMATPELVTPQPDWPANTLVTGFCDNQLSFLGNPTQSAALQQFATAGPPPLLVAPGGRDRARPNRFVSACLDACHRLDQRAVFVLGPRFHRLVPKDPRFLTTGYMPYSSLLEPISAVIHSGGIGALGWAIRQGKPSLLLPSEWDQFDNARRATERGFARTLPPHTRGRKLAVEISRLIADPWPALEDRGKAVAAECGTKTAANAIECEFKATMKKLSKDKKDEPSH